jgi:hypothetical protein
VFGFIALAKGECMAAIVWLLWSWERGADEGCPGVWSFWIEDWEEEW